MTFLQTHNKAMARILVSLNPSKGLAKTIPLQYKDYVFEQILDYEHLPFRCHRCHVYGHLAKDCPLGRRRRRFQRTMAQMETDSYQDMAPQGFSHDASQLEKEPDPVPQQEPQLPKVSSPDPHSRMEVEAPEPGIEHPILESLKDDAAAQITNLDEDSKGMNLDPLSSPNLISDSFNKCLVPDSANCMPENIDSIKILEGENVETCIDLISAAIPALDLNCEGCSSEPPPLVPLPSCPYNLRSLDHKSDPQSSVGGIDQALPQSQPRKKRGRKSSLSMAQVKAKHDVADGKQLSIPGALRAVQGPEKVPK